VIHEEVLKSVAVEKKRVCDGGSPLESMSTSVQRMSRSYHCINMSATPQAGHLNPAQQQTHQQHKRKCRDLGRRLIPARLLLGVIVAISLLSPALALHSPPDKNFSGDNRKPAFKNCAGYAPKVKEEQPENTYVLTVEAVDPDPDQVIRYSIVQSPFERPKFFINPSTGVIFTTHTFDRDEPIHEKFVFVTVQATDNGLPPLDDVCTFNVTIEDINDNAPAFNKARYDESMSENAQVSFLAH